LFTHTLFIHTLFIHTCTYLYILYIVYVVLYYHDQKITGIFNLNFAGLSVSIFFVCITSAALLVIFMPSFSWSLVFRTAIYLYQLFVSRRFLQWIKELNNVLALFNFAVKMKLSVLTHLKCCTSDFFLFDRLKKSLRGIRFESVEAMKQKSLEVLMAIQKIDFQKGFEE